MSMFGPYAPYAAAGYAAYKGGGYARSAWRKYRTPKRRVKMRYSKVPRRFKKNLLALKENKFNNIGTNPAPVVGTSAVVRLTGIAQGDTDITRDADNIYVTSVQMKSVWSSVATTIEDTILKIFLVQQRDVRGTILGITELFDTDSVTSMRQVDNSKNFRILKQKTIRIPAKAGPIADNIITNVQYDMYYKFKNPIRTKYQGTSSAVASDDRNALYLIFMCNQSSGTAATGTATIRVTFKDV